MHKHNDIAISKVTHAARVYAAQNTRKHGTSASDTKALGGWNEGGAFRACYDRTFPIGALLGAATFMASKPETYFLPRDVLVPPNDLVAQIFPWVEQELAALNDRVRHNRYTEDYALRHFLRLLIFLRKIIIQDAALLFALCPNANIWTYFPFSDPQFHAFAASAPLVIRQAEEKARQAFRHVPDYLANGIRTVTTGIMVDQRQFHGRTQGQLEQMDNRMVKLEEMITQLTDSQKPRRKRQRCQPKSDVASKYYQLACCT